MTDVDTITIPKADYDALLERLEDAEDRAIIAERRNSPTLSLDAVKRHMAGESLVTLWREERGFTQRALAEKAGMSVSMLNEVEKGKKTPSLPMAKALAQALGPGLTVDDLFDD